MVQFRVKMSGSVIPRNGKDDGEILKKKKEAKQ